MKHIYNSVRSLVSFLHCWFFSQYESSRDNDHYILYHSLLIFPTRFKEFLTTHQNMVLLIFFYRVFGEDSQDYTNEDEDHSQG